MIHESIGLINPENSLETKAPFVLGALRCLFSDWFFSKSPAEIRIPVQWTEAVKVSGDNSYKINYSQALKLLLKHMLYADAVQSQVYLSAVRR